MDIYWDGGWRVRLSTGREEDVVSAIIGLSVLGGHSSYTWDAWPFYSGNDDSHPTKALKGDPEIFSDWTPEERSELAEFMVERWREWARKSPTADA